MIEIALKEIQKDYGSAMILQDFNLEIHTGERLGLIGKNGSGKTTLFRIMTEQEKQDKGKLVFRKGIKLGSLEQIFSYPEETKVIDVLNLAFEEVLAISRQMRDLEQQMGQVQGHKQVQGDELEKIIEQHGSLQLSFEQKGGYGMEEKRNKITTGLKIDAEFQDRKFNALSGGEKTLVGLCKLLLQDTDVLLLDEPTNNLDLEAVEWLEEFLAQYEGTVVVISHDRYFLNEAVTKIVELEDGESEIYHGNFDYYVEEKEKRLLRQFEDYKVQQREIRRLREVIKRLRDWGNRSGEARWFHAARNVEKRIERLVLVENPTLDQERQILEGELNQFFEEWTQLAA